MAVTRSDISKHLISGVTGIVSNGFILTTDEDGKAVYRPLEPGSFKEVEQLELPLTEPKFSDTIVEDEGWTV